MKIVFATSNPGKLREVRQVLELLKVEVLSLDSLEHTIPEPVEDADSFAGNALIKARAYAEAAGVPCLAEDSGLVVDALDGAPGVHSARYSGASGVREEIDEANNQKLLSALDGVPDAQRTARFVCSMCVCSPDGTVLATSEGSFEGRIATQEFGDGGFGYDPLFWLEDRQCTSAQLSPDEKNARSHRGKATRALAEKLAQALGVQR